MQNPPPLQIIVVDDGSITHLPYHVVRRVTFIQEPIRTMNLGKLFNKGIKEVKTPLFVPAEPFNIPALDFANLQLRRIQRGTRIIPRTVDTDWNIPYPLVSFGNYFPKMGRCARCGYATLEMGKVSCWGSTITRPLTMDEMMMGCEKFLPSARQKFPPKHPEGGDSILCPYAPEKGAMMYTEDFLGYSEDYRGRGYYDLDYTFRWQLANNAAYGFEDCVMYHITHPRTDKDFYQTFQMENFLKYRNNCDKYAKQNIIKLL